MSKIYFTVFCLTVLFAACSDDPVSDKKPPINSGTVEYAEHPDTNDFVEFYDITWEYDSGTGKLSFGGRLKSVNEAVKLQGLSIYLVGDDMTLGDGSGFLLFLRDNNGEWEIATVMRWWITVDVPKKPDEIAIFSDLRIWLDENGKPQHTQEIEKLGFFSLDR